MLSESRKKLKWSQDPHNLNWANDENKFGLKMMQKMGWSKGKGLGTNEDGSVEHVKVRVKNNTHGLGASKSHANNWIAHQDGFADLLSNLNSNHDSVQTEEKNKEVHSLESKSRSQKKVHYHKFARGKDLSRYKDNDIAAIFGQRTHSAPPSPKHKNIEKDELISKLPEVKSELSVQEYFAKQMKIKRKINEAPDDTEESSEKKIKTLEIEEEKYNKCEEVSKKKRKKKKKKKEKSE